MTKTEEDYCGDCGDVVYVDADGNLCDEADGSVEHECEYEDEYDEDEDDGA